MIKFDKFLLLGSVLFIIVNVWITLVADNPLQPPLKANPRISIMLKNNISVA